MPLNPNFQSPRPIQPIRGPMPPYFHPDFAQQLQQRYGRGGHPSPLPGIHPLPDDEGPPDRRFLGPPIKEPPPYEVIGVDPIPTFGPPPPVDGDPGIKPVGRTPVPMPVIHPGPSAFDPIQHFRGGGVVNPTPHVDLPGGSGPPTGGLFPGDLPGGGWDSLPPGAEGPGSNPGYGYGDPSWPGFIRHGHPGGDPTVEIPTDQGGEPTVKTPTGPHDDPYPAGIPRGIPVAQPGGLNQYGYPTDGFYGGNYDPSGGYHWTQMGNPNQANHFGAPHANPSDMYGSGDGRASGPSEVQTTGVGRGPKWYRQFSGGAKGHQIAAGGTGLGHTMKKGFAHGGVVPGPTSVRRDTVPSMLTPGEVILNQRQQGAVRLAPGAKQMLPPAVVSQLYKSRMARLKA